MLSVHEQVQMVWYVAVRNEREPFADCGARNLRTHDVDARGVYECLVLAVSAKNVRK